MSPLLRRSAAELALLPEHNGASHGISLIHGLLPGQLLVMQLWLLLTAGSTRVDMEVLHLPAARLFTLVQQS